MTAIAKAIRTAESHGWTVARTERYVTFERGDEAVGVNYAPSTGQILAASTPNTTLIPAHGRDKLARLTEYLTD